MFHAHFVTKRRTFKHLNAYQRGQIEATLCLGMLAADECKKRKRRLVKIRAKAAEAVAEGIANLREPYGAQFSQVFRTITCNKGREFARLQEAVPEAKVHYAHPYPFENVERTRSRMRSFGIPF